jgi:hypothetical protein
MCNFVFLDASQKFRVDELLHDVSWTVDLGCHQVDVKLAIGMVERKEPHPSFFWLFTRFETRIPSVRRTGISQLVIDKDFTRPRCVSRYILCQLLLTSCR